MAYVLEHTNESNRLEYQATLHNYRLKPELEHLHFLGGERVLDAGCGSGLVARYLAREFGDQIEMEACDRSAVRLNQARDLANNARNEKIRFFESDLTKISAPSDRYDQVVCRFVFEHLDDASVAAREFFRIVKPGGRACVIDLDGILFNLYTSNEMFNNLMSELIGAWKTDLFVGRKIPALLKAAGFENIKYRIQLMQFQGQELTEELELTRQRLDFIEPTLIQFLGAEKAKLFAQLYCSEMLKEDATLFYTKFIVDGTKPKARDS